MKSGIVGLGLTLSAVILATPARAADHPDASAFGSGKPAAASLSKITQRTISEFVDAYTSRNSIGLARTTTRDFAAQYGLAQTGAYVTVDEDALVASWRDADANASVRGAHSKATVFPTADANAVFVTYRIAGEAGRDRIALLELRGNRVARVHDLTAPVPDFIEFAGRAKSALTVAEVRGTEQVR